MPKKSCWISTCKLPKFPRLERDLKVDVVVVGGGITGVTSAYLLKKAGLKVALLERKRCAQVDTGHTTAHLTYVTDIRLHKLVSSFGRDHAAAAWDAGAAAIDQVETIVSEEDIACDFRRVPGYLHAPWHESHRHDASQLREDARLAEELGFASTYVDSVPFVQRAGIRFADQARFHPLRYLAGLLQRIPGRGSHVFENTEADEFPDDPHGVKARSHLIRCGHTVLATHVPLMGKSGFASATLFQSKLVSYSSYAVGATLPRGTIPDALYWDTDQPYHYLRLDEHPHNDYLIFGGEDHKTGQQADPSASFDSLEKTLASFVPEARVRSRWTAQVVETHDGLPLIGETAPRQFVATGFAGNGMTFGTVAGMMAVDAVLGKKNPWRELFDVERKKLSKLWNYLKENLDYPYYYLKDKLSAAEGKSLRAVKRGEGKILQLDGKRVAAHRDTRGKVTLLEPECTHMGCLVRWNKADSTWDCPCHGSRFQPTGAVLAGPAEAPLTPADDKKKSV